MAGTQSVPIINLAPVLSGDPEGTRKVVDEVRRACEATGFLVVTNHGIDRALQQRMFQVCREFFDRPQEEKDRIAQGVVSSILGYNAMGSQRVAYSRHDETPPDLMESYTAGRSDIDESDPYFTSELGRQVFPRNVWPEHPATLRPVFEDYYGAAVRLSERIMELFAIALDLPPTFFADKIDKSLNFLRALNYPGLAGEALPGQSRIGAHTDYGALTIVMPSGPGLQVESPRGGWEDVPFTPGCLQVNIGDLMERWTNDRWVSTMHRVLPSTDALDKGQRRMSVAFFLMGKYDALVEPLPTCVDAEHGPKYPAITAGDHMFEKINRQFSLTQETRKILDPVTAG